MRAFWRRVATATTAVLTASLLSAVVQPAAARAGEPSVPLPNPPSTPVSQQQLGTLPQDQASAQALHGDQKPGQVSKEGGGTTKATPLSPSATWDVSAQTGDFTWSYPLRVPPAPGNSQPSLALSYASSTVDGRTSSTNNQASWIGEGWDLSPGFIERTYGGCSEDDGGGTNPPDVGDLCWRSDNAIAAYGGSGGALIRNDANGDWRAQNDDGSRIERVTTNGNGDDNGESWKITAVNGTRYFFGSRPGSKSTWTVPVFGDDAGEPCHASTFAASHCVQAWRWNLDKVVDRHGNVTVYNYETETNSYGLNLKDAAVSYMRAGTLKNIEYGLREDDAAVPATGRVEFALADRCVPGSQCTPDKKENWPDVAWEDKCDTATCKDHYTPSFWSTKRLAKITTQVRRGDEFTDVDSWTLDQQFPQPDGGRPSPGEKPALWLKSIVHTGHVGTATALPPVTFEGTALPNRVYKVDGLTTLNRFRVTGVISESGGYTSIAYAEPDCVEGSSMPANPETNTLRCFPVRWNKKDHAERTDYFHKYVVKQVTESDRITANTAKQTNYTYLGGAGWHYDTSEFTPADKKSWNEFRGFARTQIRTGQANDPSGPVSKTEQRFYRGMHGDKLPSGTRTVSVDPSEGPDRVDEDWLQGAAFESITYDGDTDRVVSKSITTPSWQGPTATRGSYKAYLVREASSEAYTALAAGGWRVTRTESSYDDRGLVLETNDLGDTTTAADDRCTTLKYARNTDRWILNLPYRTETVAVRCGAEPSFPADAISDSRVSYDGLAAGEPPTRGDATKSEELASRPASGPVYVTLSTAKYDGPGRAIETTDALGRVSKVAYTPADGGPTTQTVATNALGHVTTSTVEPSAGLPIKVVDPNRRITESAYDALGRVVEVWQPNRSRAEGKSGNTKFSYLIRADAPPVVKTTTLGPNGNYTTVNTVYDGLLRTRQIQQPAAGGGRLLTDTRYDSQGRVFKETEPFFNDAEVDDKLWVAGDTEVASLTRTEFDGAGRPTAAITYGGARELWRTTTSYGGDRVHVDPPAGATPTTEISDARGQTVELRQYRGAAPTGAYDATTHTYTKSGHLASTTDPAGNTWRHTYDLRGNEIKTEDADKGTATMTYDVLGKVVTATDARGVTLTYGYDALGRRTAVRNGTATLASWTYDTATKGKGQPATSTRYLGEAAYTRAVTGYTALYQPAESTVTIPETEQTLAGTYTVNATYNPDGSASGVAMPAVGDLAAETVTHQYDDLAMATTTSGGLEGGGVTTNYVTDTQYTRFGEVARVQLGDTGKRVWQSYYYDAHTRRLDRTIVDAEVPRPMQADLNYTYDPAGNVTLLVNSPLEQPADKQCFRYDHLRRLTESWTPSGGCGDDPSVPALAGPAPYWQSFTYDKVGNRLTETQHAAGGDTTRKYTYPTPGAHALQSVATTTAAGTKTDEFSYDASGNTTRRALAAGAQDLTWDAQGKLAKVTEGAKVTEFAYDADGNRLIRRDPTGSTLYLDGQELRLDKATGKRNGTRYYEHDGATIALRTAAGVAWLASDHQDTAQYAIDSADEKVTQRRQTPFGAPRGAAVQFPGEKGFVGGTIDASTGLTQLGARAYDALLGRFISVDPVMDLNDPQQLHGYTYSNNNPITASDPNGLLWGWLKGMGEKIGNRIHQAGKALKKIGNAIAEGAKWAAPVLGIAAFALGTIATGGGLAAGALAIAAAGAAGAGMIAGGINMIHACTGGGSGVDCAMEAIGLVPGLGKFAVGAGRWVGRRIGEAANWAINKGAEGAGKVADRMGVLNGGGARAATMERYANSVERTNDMSGSLNMLKQDLGRGYTMFDNTVGLSNVGWSVCGITANISNGGNCMGLPSIGAPSRGVGWVPTRTYTIPRPIPMAPLVVYPDKFVGPIPHTAVRHSQVKNGVPPSLMTPGPPPKETYKNNDGAICHKGGGMCAI